MWTRHPQIFLTPSAMRKASSRKVRTISATLQQLSAGDYGDAAYTDSLGSIFTFDLPAQELFIGGVEALGF